MEYLTQHIESLIFAAEQPITLDEIGGSLEEVFGMAFNAEDLSSAIADLQARYR
ncbi:MAG: SMC-Scp complex subunit ScpB, partial [Saprospiraceae bacterium]|nr:SMC-Scp complex subunit ScpB [Saprospiraceae bacterium]